MEPLGKGNHPPCSAGWVLASTQGVHCQKQKGLGTLLPTRGRHEQPVSPQGHRVLWKTSLSSIFPLIPCLEQSQSHREGTRMGATVTDSHSQHVSKGEHTRRKAPVFKSAPGTACSEPWRCCTHPQLSELGTVSQCKRSQIQEPE